MPEIVSTPVAPPAAVPKPPQAASHSITKTTLGGRVRPSENATGVTKPVAEPVAKPAATPAAKPIVEPVATAAPAASAETVAEPAAKPETAATTTTEPVRLTEDESYKRAARIRRESMRVEREKLDLANQRKSDASMHDKVKLIEQFVPAFRANPLRALQDGLGIPIHEARQILTGALIGEQAKTPQQRAIEEQQTQYGQIQASLKQIEDFRREQVASVQQTKIAEYLKSSVEPILAGNYPHLKHAAAISGQDLAQAIFRAQQAEHKRTGKVPTAKSLADAAEAGYAKLAKEKLGQSSPAVEATASSNGATPKSQASGQASKGPLRKKSAPYTRRMVSG
jgi:plasmid stability protein